jgi:hypothetical protein
MKKCMALITALMMLLSLGTAAAAKGPTLKDLQAEIAGMYWG